MSDDRYQVSLYQPEYRDQVLELLTPLWGSDFDLKSDYFKWKYEHNPYCDRPLFYITLFEEQVVGVRGSFGMRWQVGEPRCQIDCLEDADAVVHIDHRRKGLLKLMTLTMLEDLSNSRYVYDLTLSANEHSGASNLKLGWLNIGKNQTSVRIKPWEISKKDQFKGYVRRIPFLRHLYSWVKSRKTPSEKRDQNQEERPTTFHRLDQYIGEDKNREQGGISIQKVPRPAAMAELIENLPHDGRFGHLRDEEYFYWRYQNPRSTYRFLFSGVDEIDGYLVIRSTFNARDGNVTIVDWEATDLRVRAQLLDRTIKMGKFQEIYVWSVSQKAEERHLLQQRGFFDIDSDNAQFQNYYVPDILIRPVNPDQGWVVAGRDLRELENWDLRAIHSDGQ